MLLLFLNFQVLIFNLRDLSGMGINTSKKQKDMEWSFDGNAG